MSLTVVFGVKGKWAAFVTSFLEMVVFFPVFTVLCFAGVRASYGLATGGDATLAAGQLIDPVSWFRDLPDWMWIIQALAYLLVITLYWWPGSDGVNDAQVLALAALLVVAGVAVAVWQHEAVARGLQTIWGVWSGQTSSGTPAA